MCRSLGPLLVVGPFIRHFFVPLKPLSLTLAVLTGASFLIMDVVLTKRPSLQRKLSYLSLTIFFFAIGTMAISAVGFMAPLITLLAIGPVFASFLLGIRGGIFAFFGAFVTMLSVYYLDVLKVIPVSSMTQVEFYHVKMVVMILLLFVSIAVAFSYEKIRTDEAKALQNALDRRETTEYLLNQTSKVAKMGGWSLEVATGELWWSDETYRIHEVELGSHVAVEEAINFYAEEARPVISSAVEKGMKTGQGWDLELPLITATGRRIWVQAIGQVSTNPDGTQSLRGTFQDITDRKNQALELKKAHDMALKAASAKSQFLANMSHEIRTPMNGVLGNAELLAEEPLSDRQHRLVNTIVKSGEAMMGILNDILDFSKIEAGHIKAEMQEFDFPDHIHSIYQLFEGSAARKGLFLSLKMPDDVPRWVKSDPTRIRQILLNLVSNAIKFSDEGGVTILLRVESKTENRAKIFIEIADTGIGISPDAISKLFEEFSQVDASTTKKYGGTGLGLAISQKLAGLLGSVIEVRSVEEVGSCFSLVLDMEIANPVRVVISEGSSKSTLDLSRLNILLVEDNSVNMELALEYLKKLDIEADTAANGQEAIEMVEQSRYDLIFMDCQMPVLDGYDATKAIRCRKIPQPHIIAMTANAMEGDREKCLNVGMDDYLSKPVSKRKIVKVLEKWAAGLSKAS